MTTRRFLLLLSVCTLLFPSRALSQFASGENSGIISFFGSDPPSGISSFFGIKESPSDKTEKLSDAERIIRLIHSIESRQKKLTDIETEQKNPVNGYARAESKFKLVDTQWLDKQNGI